MTARVQAKYDPAEKEIQIVSRTVTAMRVTIPPYWVPATLNWNGLPLEEIQAARVHRAHAGEGAVAFGEVPVGTSDA